jgi:hypothetical protein
MRIHRSIGFCAALVCGAVPAVAQTTSAPPPSSETRPATTTAAGDTGLWFVPTGEILPARRWSFSGYRVNFDYEQGFTDVSRFPITFGAGVSDRVELFGSVTAVTRIDRDLRPLFLATLPETGGVVNEYPFVNDGWSGNQFGDIWLGAKLNLTSQHRQQAAAFALRGMLKVPTGSEDDGAGTGKMDFAIDAIVSRELNERVELSGFGGVILRGDPDEWNLTNGFRCADRRGACGRDRRSTGGIAAGRPDQRDSRVDLAERPRRVRRRRDQLQPAPRRTQRIPGIRE